MLCGERVKLRPIEKKDITALNKWKNDVEIFKYLGGGFLPISIDQQSNWMESLIDNTGNNKRFIICNPDNNSIGMIGLYGINWIHRTCEIGLYIGEVEEHGKGYAKESYNLIEEFARRYLNLRKITLQVVDDNLNATKFWTKRGFKYIGKLKQERFIDGEYMDLAIMEKFI